MSELKQAGTLLWQARQDGSLTSDAPFPQSRDEAYAAQQAAISASGHKLCGYKIGATSAEIQTMLGLEEAFYGPVFDVDCYASKSAIKVHEQHGAKVEPEFVICLGKDIKPQNQAIVTNADVEAAIDWVAPAFEIIGSRWADFGDYRGFCVIADFGSNLALTVGEPFSDWRELDLSCSPVALSINGEEVASGHSGLSIAGNPISIVSWLANHPGMRQHGLKKGEIISCGTCTEVKPVKAGDHLSADYGPLGILETSIVAA